MSLLKKRFKRLLNSNITAPLPNQETPKPLLAYQALSLTPTGINHCHTNIDPSKDYDSIESKSKSKSKSKSFEDPNEDPND